MNSKYTLKSLLAAAFLLVSAPSLADVWMWIDPLGDARFVDTVRPIFTWVGDDGKVYFSDTPDDDDAVAVQFVWHSRGSVSELDDDAETDVDALRDAETEDERIARMEAQKHYCKRVTEMYDAYRNAPALYRTDEDGDRVYLKKYEVRRAVREVANAQKAACQDAA